LRGNAKQWAGAAHPQRDAQFVHIAAERARHLDQGQPVISVDTKKKELLGNFKNNGHTWTAQPEVVNVHDFESAAVGRAVPYGIYDSLRNHGTVYVGQSADTPQFAVEAIAAGARAAAAPNQSTTSWISAFVIAWQRMPWK